MLIEETGVGIAARQAALREEGPEKATPMKAEWGDLPDFLKPDAVDNTESREENDDG